VNASSNVDLDDINLNILGIMIPYCSTYALIKYIVKCIGVTVGGVRIGELIY
jgi:hypothetical protein